MRRSAMLSTAGAVAFGFLSLGGLDTPAEQPRSSGEQNPSLEQRVAAEADTIKQSNADKFHVTPDAHSSGGGDSWDDPTTLRSALADAEDQDSVLVQAGEYAAADSSFTINGEHVLGGIQSGDERRIDDAYTPDGDPTELLGTDSNRVVTIHDGSLTNARVTGGTATGDGMAGRGGGILVKSGDTDLSRLLVQNNEAANGGSGLSIENGSGAVHVVGSSFTNNHTERGGTIFTNGDRPVTIQGNTLHGNSDASDDEYYAVTSETTNPTDLTMHGATSTEVSQNALHSFGAGNHPVADGSITGTVTEEGHPISDERVTVKDDAVTKADTTTAEDGTFTMPFSYETKDVTIGFSSEEHVNTDTTFTHSGDATITINANRTDYDLETMVNGLIGGEEADVSVKDDLGELITATQGNETITYSLSTEYDSLFASADAIGHQHGSASTELTGDKAQSLSLTLTPWTHTRNVVSDGDTLTVTHDDETLTKAAITGDTTTVQYDISDDVTHGDDLIVAATAANSDTAATTTTLDTTNTEQTFRLNPSTNTVTASVNGSTGQEGETLPNASITARNADADTTVANLTSDRDGDYSFSTTYPDGAAYTLNVIANTSEHEADTTTVELDNTDKSHTADIDLDRLVHDVTITTQDSTTRNTVPATGTIKDANADTTITTYQTSTDGQVTTTITTPTDQITTNADTTNYDPATTTTTLGASKAISVTNALPPIQYTFNGSVTDTDGNALSGASIVLTDDDGNTVNDTTASDGSYNLNTTVNEGITENEDVTISAKDADYEKRDTTLTADPTDRTKTTDLSLPEIIDAVVASVNGSTTQEGLTLPDANITARNADADTTVANIKSGSEGDYSFTTSYPENESYTLNVIANTDEHQADTTTIDSGSVDSTYTADVDVERLTYNITTDVSGLLSGETGTVTVSDAAVLADTTIGNGSVTQTVDTEASSLDVSLSAAGHKDKDTTITVNGDADHATSLTTTPWTHTRNVASSTGDSLFVEHNSTVLTEAEITGDTTTVQYDISDDVTHGDVLDVTVTGANRDPAATTTTLDTTDLEQTLTLNPSPYSVTATFDGSTDQEGTTLPNADITIQNTDADTTVANIQSGSEGNYQAPTTYPSTDAFTAAVIANTSEHRADTTTVQLDTTPNTYTNNFNLERLLHQLTITTQDSTTRNTVPATGTIKDANADTTITTYQTSTDGQVQKTITTNASEITSKADTTNYDENTTSTTLNGEKDKSILNQLPPIQYTLEGTVTGPTTYTVTLKDSDGNQTSVTTSNPYSITGSINEAGFQEGETVTMTFNADGWQATDTTLTADPSDRTKTINTTLHEATTNYTITGTVTDDDGDQLSNKDVLIQTTGDNTVASTTTGSDGSYSVSVTQDELGGDTGEVQSNPAGYNEAETTKTFTEGNNTVDLTLPLTEYTRTFNVDDANDNPLSNASIDADETTSGDRDVFTATTNTSGEHTETMTIDDMVVDGDQLEYAFNKDGYNPETTTETLTDTTKTITASLDEQNTTDRITITFNDKTVGNSLYSGGYSGELDYTINTPDTTAFTVSGQTEVTIPISDGDQLEISQSDAEYISTFMVNNTDTELPPMQVDPFPAEPDYQSTSAVSIDKSNVVNEYQVAGIPDTSPEGYNTIDDWKPHLDDNDVRRWTDLGGLSSLETYIQEGHSDGWEEKTNTVVPEVQGFLPIPIDGPTYVTDSELQDIFDERNERNITRVDGGGNSFSVFTEGNYLNYTAAKFSDANNYVTVRSEVYGAFTGMDERMDETEDHFVTTKILNDEGEFIPTEAKFPLRIIYSTESPTNIY